MKIALKDLKIACEKIIEEAEKSGFESMEVNSDFYWTISSDDAANFDKEPEIIVGSYVDDWDSLKKIVTAENPTTSVDFDRLGNVIIIIGETIHKNLYQK